MKLNHFHNAKQFYERVKSYLLLHEAHHNLLLGISNTLIVSPNHFPFPPYLVTVEQDEQVLAVALRTPPSKLVLSLSVNFEAIGAIAQDLFSRSEPLPGIIAPVQEAKTFATVWQTLTAKSYTQGKQLRIHLISIKLSAINLYVM